VESRASPGIIRGKVSVPTVSDRVIARPRLTQRLGHLIESHRVTLVVATAGSGKTTAVVQALNRSDRPAAWLTLEAIDTATGRFLTYLEASVAEQAPVAAGVASAALAARLSHSEAAGLLAESLTDSRMVVVLDGVESITDAEGGHTLATLGTFIRYAPPGVRFVVVGRAGMPLDTAGFTGLEDFAVLGEHDLAFTDDEARDALLAAGAEVDDARGVVAATGGWVTGVLFEAWRSDEHVAGTGGEMDPLHGYLATQILDRLDPEERELLVLGSVLDEVTAVRAQALGVSNAGDLLVSLRAKHLPVTWTPGTYAMRCHPRFREYLSTLLARRDAGQLAEVRLAHARLLVAEGHQEEAVEEFLLAGARDEAVDAAEAAIGDVVARLDLAVAERWLAQLARDSGGSLRLGEAEVSVAIAREEFGTAVDVADRLRAEGVREPLAAHSATAAAMMAWAYWHTDRCEDAREVLATAPVTPETDAVRYLLDLVSPGAEGPVPTPRLTGGPLDALVMRVDYTRGRLAEVLGAPPSPWSGSVSAPWRAGALRATGRLEEALDLLRSGPHIWATAWMHGVVAPEIMIDLGRADDARAAISAGRQQIRASGSTVFLWLNWLIEAKMELRMFHNVSAAVDILDRAERAGARRYGFIAELMDLWRGLAHLQADHAAEALETLERAAATMTAGDRDLELPAVQVYLAEAWWRLGEQDAADLAADRAMEAARRQGSNHQLILALSDCPAVVARRLDAESGSDSPWHALGRTLLDAGVTVQREAALAVRIREFGELSITVDGVTTKPRIAKSLQLLAYLATQPGHEASREALLEVLFDGRDDNSTRSYLRQAVHRLREALPSGVGPSFVGRTLQFASPITLVSESETVFAQLASARRLRGRQLVDAVRGALAATAAGEYLPGVDSEWATDRRGRLATLASQARLQAAQASHEAEDYLGAERLVRDVLSYDPYQESAWRLLMRIGAALGDEDRVIASFRACQAALGELGAQPSDYTRRLLDQLRR
jgi:DNA-binding SARP family transcriptional activator